MAEELTAEFCEDCNCDQYFKRMADSLEIIAGQPTTPVPQPEPEPQPEPTPTPTFVVTQTLLNPERAKLLPENNTVGAKKLPDGTKIYVHLKDVLQVIRHFPRYWEVIILDGWQSKFIGQRGYLAKDSAIIHNNPELFDWSAYFAG